MKNFQQEILTNSPFVFDSNTFNFRKEVKSFNFKYKKGESKQFPKSTLELCIPLKKSSEVFFVTLHWRPHAGKRSGFIPLPNWPKSTNILGFEWDLKSQNMLWSK